LFFSLLRQRRGATGLSKLQRERVQNKYFATAPAHIQHACTAPTAQEVEVVKPIHL
jgi:hypothetical protein